MKKLLAILFFFSLLGGVSELQAQNRFALTAQVGYGTGAYETTYTGLGSGSISLRLNASYTIIPILDAYAGYSRVSFSCSTEDTGFCQGGVDLTSSGFSLGLRLNRGVNASVWIPWLRAGVVYKTLEASQENYNYSDTGIGFEIGAGLAYPVSDHIKIVPSVNYTRYSITTKDGFDNSIVTVSALIGARYEF